MKKQIQKILYIIIPAALLVWMLGYEFFWRFDPSLDLVRRLSITDRLGVNHTLVLHQHSNSSVDTIRRMFGDMQNGKTEYTLWLEGSGDTIHSVALGRYFSEFREFRIAIDSSSQVMLIPNTEHDLPTGWGEMIYLTPEGSMKSMQVINANIADMDHDGKFELFDKLQGSWTKLDPATGNWTPVTIKPRSVPN